MKTITEFPGVQLRMMVTFKNSLDLSASADAAAELSEKVGGQYKIEGDRLAHLIKVLTMVEPKVQQVARVRVFQGEDETKLPKGFVKEGDHYYVVEYVAAPEKKQNKPAHGKGEKDGKRGRGKGGRGGRGGRDSLGGNRDKDSKGPRGPRQA